MIIAALKGGLGNQLFQYALGRALARKNQDDLKLDLTALTNAEVIGNIHRDYELGNFNITASIANDEEIASRKPIPSLFSVLLRKIRNRLYGDTTVFYNPAILKQTGDIYLDGYWQSPLFFNDIRAVLLKEITLNKTLSVAGANFAKQIKNTNAVSLHVRRGDFINNPRVKRAYGTCSLNYYKSAMAEIEKTIPSPTYFVFSDDIDWVKEHLKIRNDTVFVSPLINLEEEELILMSMCQHNIIANSSFSWWGAWLNQNPNKIVVVPTPWFNKSPYDKNLIPENWIKLPK